MASKNKAISPKWESPDLWECNINKMYDNSKNIDMIQQSKELLTSDCCYEKMKQVTIEWKTSTMVNFTNKMFNPVSWLGQAACCLNHGAKSSETVGAWLKMTKEEQQKANDIAKEVIEEWKNENL